MENSLKSYHQKREFNKTPEPKGKKILKKKSKLRFVVQHHLARQEHYDFRFEYEGVLKSWAIPKGPSYNPKVKRLAVMVEDHPYSYRNFEGVIPKGSYGAGSVLLFDEGIFEPLSDLKQGFKQGILKFKLHGTRLIGAWTLVKMDPKNWLLIKEKDGLKKFTNIKEFTSSIKTNRTHEEIKANIPLVVSTKKEVKIANIKITNPNKIIYPKYHITKLDIAKYYAAVSKRMLALIKKRPLSVIRAPSPSSKFFKKHFEVTNTGLGKFHLKNKQGVLKDYYYLKNLQGLIKEVQMNSFEFHIWGCTYPKIEKPNLMVFDLDPDEKLPLKKVREGVQDLKDILDELKLTSYLKTSGNKGYHVLIFLESASWTTFSKIAHDIASLLVLRYPNKYTTEIKKEARTNKIFIDYLRNIKQATFVAPYSLRLKDKPTVSMPIAWSDLYRIKPDGITIQKALELLNEKDPWQP